jgi:hypothetical protein
MGLNYEDLLTNEKFGSSKKERHRYAVFKLIEFRKEQKRSKHIAGFFMLASYPIAIWLDDNGALTTAAVMMLFLIINFTSVVVGMYADDGQLEQNRFWNVNLRLELEALKESKAKP